MIRLWLDERLGGCPRWRYCDDRELMQILDELRQAVCFISAHRPVEPRIGSAFFVGMPLEVNDRWVVYVVTARHCIDPVDAHGDVEWIGLRLNTRAGASAELRTDPKHWIRHPTADIAVLPLAPPQETFEYKFLPVSTFVTSAQLRDKGFGPGEDVLITGLLVNHPGRTRIMPIVRIGNIAGYPDEAIRLETGDDVVALVEVRSIGGLSGSPAYVHIGPIRRGPRGGTAIGGGGGDFLMGLVHGFYPQIANDPDGVVPPEGLSLNTGITAVVFSDRILELLNRDDLSKARETMTDALRRESAPVPATAREAGGSEFASTESLLAKLLQVPKAELDDKLREHGEG
jgi:hypothetical protein